MKVQINPPAAEAATDQPAKIKLIAGVDITDDLGRVITIGKPKPLDNLDFAKAAGSGGDINKVYLSEVFHLKFVRAIDGQRVPTPASEGELRALYARLDEAGNEAVQTGVLKHFMSEGAQEDVRRELGNS